MIMYSIMYAPVLFNYSQRAAWLWTLIYNH